MWNGRARLGRARSAGDRSNQADRTIFSQLSFLSLKIL